MNRCISALFLFGCLIFLQFCYSSAGSGLCLGWCNSTCNCAQNYTFQCKNGQCIPLRYYRNGKIDCTDGTDEHIACCDGYFKCDTKKNSIGKCLQRKLMNNNITECHDGTDEDANIISGCDTYKSNAARAKIPENMYFYTCHPANPSLSIYGKCITIDYVLDGKSDCPMEDDEDPANFDECALKIHQCSEYATCNNIEGGTYTCTCNAGYTGDGESCTQI